jgi:beta-phosphoglucomutase-like phosphatase (HAD superfamily)
MRHMFSAAIFDMDGLLIDSELAIMNAWITVGCDLGVEILPTDYLQIVGRSKTECHIILTGLFGETSVFQEALTRVRQKLIVPAVYTVFPLKSGAHALLRALASAGIPCAVASSSTREEIQSRLAQVDVLHFFGAIAGGDEVDRGKPDPAVYKLAADRLQKSPADCLAFEDSENGTLAATSAGMAVVIVPDIKPPTSEVMNRSFRVLERLDDAIEHVPIWFSAHTHALS